ncbi:MAG: methyltransferase domain-containing protein [Sideroxydans sp.]|nr:methyltransferase domain-containing protein [Sideroxydans sp.]
MSTTSLADWLESSHGHYLMEREQDFIDQSVADIFGYNAVQIGLPQYDLLHASRIPLRVTAASDPAAKVKVDVDELPFESGSIDLVLLPHVLEFNAHPHQILREVERIMMPEGHVIITGFNPRSLWGIRRALSSRMEYPWCGHFISLPRIKDWLALMGLEVVAGRFACYAPPLTNPAWLKRLRFMEPAGDRWWAVCGGVYFLQAIKRVPGMRPIKPQWNESLVEKLLPVRPKPKLNRELSQRRNIRSQ